MPTAVQLSNAWLKPGSEITFLHIPPRTWTSSTQSHDRLCAASSLAACMQQGGGILVYMRYLKMLRKGPIFTPVVNMVNDPLLNWNFGQYFLLYFLPYKQKHQKISRKCCQNWEKTVIVVNGFNIFDQNLVNGWVHSNFLCAAGGSTSFYLSLPPPPCNIRRVM